MHKTCDRCGHENPDWCTYCQSCGISLALAREDALRRAARRSGTPATQTGPAGLTGQNLTADGEQKQVGQAGKAISSLTGELLPENVITTTPEVLKQAVREVLHEIQNESRARFFKTLFLTVMAAIFIGAGLTFGGWRLYSELVINVEKAERDAEKRVLDIIDDLQGLKSACLLFYADNKDNASAKPDEIINGKIEPLLPYLVMPVTSPSRIIVQDGVWYIEYTVDDDARVRTALRDKAGELGLLRNTKGAIYNGGDTIYLIGRS